MSNISSLTLTTINSFEAQTVALARNPQIVELAMKVAYYQAMIDAALDDPLDDPDEQAAVLELLTARRDEHTEAFQELVNQNL